jgi:phenylacetate-CoA ligase
MNLLRTFYELSPIPVQHLLTSVYGFHLHRLRYGGVYHKVLEEIEETQWLSPARIRELQLERLHSLLRHAKDRCPYYGDLLGEAGLEPEAISSSDDLSALPLTGRAEVARSIDAMVDLHARRSQMITHYTSGTTGTPLKLLLDKNTYRRNYAFWTRFRRWFSWHMGKPRATLSGRIIVPAAQTKPPFWRYNAIENQLVMSSFHVSRSTTKAYVEKLCRFQPFVVEGYVSSIYSLARFAEEQQLQMPHPHAVQTTSETLLPHQRTQIERVFGCKAYDQYGHGECAVFVSECEKGSLHVNDEYGVVEVVKQGRAAAPGEVGEVVVTGLNNWTMPLIRYRTGDLASLAPEGESCACGRGLSMLASLEGRVLDVLHLPDGRTVPPTALTLLFDRAHTMGIEEARVRQVERARILVELVRIDKQNREQGLGLERELRLIVGSDVRIDILDVEKIPRTTSGKFKFVQCEIEESTL